MAFKVRDLMINYLPSAPPGQCEASTPFLCGASMFATVNPTCSCGPRTGFFGFEASPVNSLASLSDLKEQLKRQLIEVEKQEAATEESLQPQSVDEVDLLMQKLTDALEELKGRRAELLKKSGSIGTK